MKMKKPISVTIALLMCLLLLPASSFAATTPTSSTYEDYANSLAPLGVFKGTGSGYELDRTPTRIEGLIMLIRLLGVEKEALSMQASKVPFTDVPKWANGYVAYAYSHNLAKGINKTKFGSTNDMEAKAFVTFLLRSLGYNDSAGDFSYTNALQYAKKINLLNDSTFVSLTESAFLRAHVAKTSYDTLKFNVKDRDIHLINVLVSEGKIDSNVASIFISLELKEPTILISPPKNIRIVDEKNEEVLINWDPVKDADYYYFYFKEEGEADYSQDIDQGQKERFHYSKDYTVTYYDLEPGKEYKVVVTSVRDGEESEKSEVLSFEKKFGGYTPYYSNFYGIPDFGKRFGVDAHLAGDDFFFYKYPDIIDDYTSSYGDALVRNGFLFMESIVEEDSGIILFYQNNYINKTVSLNTETIDGVKGLYVCVIDEVI